MNFLSIILSWLFRALAFLVGQERVVTWFIRAAEKSGTPELGELIRSKYFDVTGKMIPCDMACPACHMRGISAHLAPGIPIRCPDCGHVFLKPAKAAQAASPEAK